MLTVSSGEEKKSVATFEHIVFSYPIKNLSNYFVYSSVASFGPIYTYPAKFFF